jgi:hypothetical protein
LPTNSATAGPFVTRALGALAIGLLAAAFLRSTAIPGPTARLVTAVSLPLLPISYPGPYIGPLNSQWWFAALVLLIALEAPRRWHFPAVFFLCLTGAAPCVALPAFWDRRIIPIAAATILQARVFLASPRRPEALGISTEFLAVAIGVGIAMVIARLPSRTRLGFAYLGLAILALGLIAIGGGDLAFRYLTVAWVAIVLGLASRLDSPPRL